MKNTQAIILAGGKGTRLQAVVNDVPKPMALVNGHPFLEYQIHQLVYWGITDIILSVGYKRDVIRDYFGNGDRWAVTIRYAEEDEPLGTGGAIREAMRLATAESVLVMNGDSFVNLDISAFLKFHSKKKAVFSLALVTLNDTGRYGRIEIDAEGRVVAFKEKQGNGPGYVNSGVYLIARNVLDIFPTSGSVSLENDILPELVGKDMFALPSSVFFIDIGVPDDYLYINSHSSLLVINPDCSIHTHSLTP